MIWSRGVPVNLVNPVKISPPTNYFVDKRALNVDENLRQNLLRIQHRDALTSVHGFDVMIHSVLL